jgi:hypothetical protein
MKQRERSVASAHDETCKWLLETSEYLAWAAETPAEQYHSFLWIKGNAGAGKSTLMKFAVENARRTQKAIILPHFFNAKGSRLEKSAEGMYRTLVVWLLQELPSAATQELNTMYNDMEEAGSWSVPELERLLKKLVAGLSDESVVFYIDALDECDQTEARAVLWVFRDLIAKAWETDHRGQVRVCFASRPYPNITFDEALYMDLGSQEEHGRDIITYIHARLRIGDGSTATQVRNDVYRKAAGIFMWVILVVDDLNRQYDDGNLLQLQQTLQAVPTGLHELFRHTLDRYPESREPMLVCFRWKLFELEELNLEQLWWGIQLGLGRSEKDYAEELSLRHVADLERYIVAVSRGLLKIHKSTVVQGASATSRHSRVELVHESLREFIFKERSIQDLYETRSREDFEAQSHERLRDWCVNELMSRRLLPATMNQHQSPPSSLPVTVNLFDHLDSPLAPYAVKQWLQHAEAAQCNNRDQTAFLDMIVKRFGPRIFYFSNFQQNPFHWVELCDMIDALLGAGCPQLIRETQLNSARRRRRDGHAIGLFTERGRQSHIGCFTPFLGMMDSNDSIESIRALVDVYMQLEPRSNGLQLILSDIANSWQHCRKLQYPISNSPKDLPLLTVSYSYPRLAIFFLLALAPAKSLQPHLAALEEITHERPGKYDYTTMIGRYLPFMLMMRLFLEEGISSDAAKFDVDNAFYRVWSEDCMSFFAYLDHDAPARKVMAEIQTLLMADHFDYGLSIDTPSLHPRPQAGSASLMKRLRHKLRLGVPRE